MTGCRAVGQGVSSNKDAYPGVEWVDIDLNRKMLAYQRNGVTEYIVWRTHDEAIDWFLLRDGLFVRQQPDERGIHKSVAFPGLWLNATALLQRDRQALLETLMRGIHSDEHARFVDGLRQKRNAEGTT